jgi:ParB/RepB/Spo0J family partition protein
MKPAAAPDIAVAPAEPGLLPLASPTRVPLAAISPHRDQPRHDFNPAKLKQLAESIDQEGVLEPILLRPDGRLVHGARRFRAARLAGLDDIPAIVTHAHPLAGALATNIHHVALTTIEEIKAVTALAEEDGVVEAARRLGKPSQWVSKRRAVGTAPDYVLAFAAAGGSRDLETLYELARLARSRPGRARELILAGGPKSLLRQNARCARRGEPELVEQESTSSPFERPVQPGTPAIGAKAPTEERSAATFVVQRLRLDGDDLVLQTDDSSSLALRLSLDLERELLELLRERLAP